MVRSDDTGPPSGTVLESKSFENTAKGASKGWIEAKDT